LTTLAYRDKTLAADSQETFDDSGRSLCQKLYHIGKGPHRGDWLAICGGSFSSRVFVDWYENPRRRRPELVDFKDGDDEDAFRILIMKPDGKLFLASASCVLIPKVAEYFAAGHGAAYAMGAMACGRTAGDSVWVACKHDEATCPPVYAARAGEKTLTAIKRPRGVHVGVRT